MPDESLHVSGRTNGELMLTAFQLHCENSVLRRLVLSMALAIPPEHLPDDERTLLVGILNDEPGAPHDVES